MTQKSKREYKGSLKGNIDALFGSTPEPDLQEARTASQTVPIEAIVLPEYQPRQHFAEEKLADLTATIAQYGILEPLVVREIEGDRYELVAGGRRYRAAQRARVDAIPVVIRSLTDEEALEISLLENIQREDLNPVEETEGILRLLESRLKLERTAVTSLLYRMRNEAKGSVRRNVSASDEASGESNGKTTEAAAVEELFANLGLTWKSFVETRLPLLKLPQDILSALQNGRLAYTKASAIAKLEDSEQRQALLAEAIAENLSLNEIKERIRSLAPAPSETPKARIQAVARKVTQSKLWESPQKWKRAQRLLEELETLAGESATKK